MLSKKLFVVPIPDEVFSEVGVAFVQFKEGRTLSDEDVKTYAREHLTNYKIPKHWHFVDAYPLLPNGKIDRTSLKEKAVSFS